MIETVNKNEKNRHKCDKNWKVWRETELTQVDPYNSELQTEESTTYARKHSFSNIGPKVRLQPT